MTQTVALNKLTVSPRNVRKTDTHEDIDGLAESIHSKGLLQNLVVSPAAGGGGIYEVDAGARRLHALQLLAQRGDLPANWPVPVRVVDRSDATEASLAENIQKVAMNPADEVEAFADIVDNIMEGDLVSREERIENCARRFGRSERYIQQRLRLAALHPDILDALRERELSIRQAEAFAAQADTDQQLKVYRDLDGRADFYREPAQIRARLLQKTCTVDDPRAVYVGMEAYRAAGGATDVDLFFGAEDREVLLDPGLITRLTKEKAQAEADALARAAGWKGAVVVVPGMTGSWLPEGYEHAWEDDADLSEAEKAMCLRRYRLGHTAALADDEQWYRPERPVEHSESETPSWIQNNREAERAYQIGLKAARLAIPKFRGTPIEGRSFWPADKWVPTIREADEGTYVALLIRVSPEEIEQHSAAAAQAIEAAEADSEDETEAEEKAEAEAA